MQALLDDPVVQSALAPLLVALLVSGVLWRTPLAWFAAASAVATEVAMSTGISFTPLSATRKALLLVLLAPFVGLVLDLLPRPSRASVPALAVVSGVCSIWVFWSLLTQGDTIHALALSAGLALFVALMVAATLRLRHDGVAAAAATVGLGLAVGVAAVLSASIGNLANGIALTAGGGALLLWQFGLQRSLAPGYLGMLSVGLAAALFAAATFMLAQLPWYALPLLLLVPLAAGLNVAARRSPRLRMIAMTLLSIAVSTATMLAAWLAARASTS